MSVRVMTLAWDTDLPAGEKLVLLALADCANDEGRCWPGVKSLCEKTGKGERSLQAALAALDEADHITRDQVPGKGCYYTVHPRKSCTPAKSAPPQKTTQTPAKSAGKPSRTVISSEAKASSPRAKVVKIDPFPKPEWADPQVWADFMENRKRKKATNSATAYRGFLADIARHADDEWPPGRLLEHAAAKGWKGIYDPRDRQHDRPASQPTGIGRTEAAIRAAIGR